MTTMTPAPPFATAEQALDACEAAGLQPRTQRGGLGETSYWVYLDNAYVAYWGDDQFLRWANAYFQWRDRWKAGWSQAQDGTWLAPDGTPEADWIADGLPLPEDPGYQDWAETYWHYEALDVAEPAA